MTGMTDATKPHSRNIANFIPSALNLPHVFSWVLGLRHRKTTEEAVVS
jgi:hypothetical protein